MNLIALAIARHWPVIYRSIQFFALGFLGVAVEKLCSILFGGNWPTGPVWAGTALSGLYQGIVALKAYNDKSAAIHDAELKEKDNGHTDFFGRPTLTTAQPSEQSKP